MSRRIEEELEIGRRQFCEWERGRIMGQIRTREVRQESQRSDSLGVPNSIRNSKELNILPEKEQVDAIT